MGKKSKKKEENEYSQDLNKFDTDLNLDEKGKYGIHYL